MCAVVAGEVVSSSGGGGHRTQVPVVTGTHPLQWTHRYTVTLPHQHCQELRETETKLGQFDQLGNTES